MLWLSKVWPAIGAAISWSQVMTLLKKLRLAALLCVANLRECRLQRVANSVSCQASKSLFLLWDPAAASITRCLCGISLATVDRNTEWMVNLLFLWAPGWSVMCKSFNFSLLPTRIYADKAGNGIEMEMEGSPVTIMSTVTSTWHLLYLWSALVSQIVAFPLSHKPLETTLNKWQVATPARTH